MLTVPAAWCWPPLSLVDDWLQPVCVCPSPHCDQRPPDVKPSLLVIHNISLPPGEFGGPYIDQLFTGQLDHQAHPFFADLVGLRVSAHLLIRREGQLVQYVSFAQRAWHAGVSVFAGRPACNDFSIGIELEGTDYIPYTARQYQQLARVIQLLQQNWPMLADARHWVGHRDIAPGRKTDPGPAFDWARLRALVATTAPPDILRPYQ